MNCYAIDPGAVTLNGWIFIATLSNPPYLLERSDLQSLT